MRLCSIFLLALAVSSPAAAQPAAQSTAPPADSPALTALVADLAQHNPELLAAARAVDMRLARIAPAGTPPDPTFSTGYMSGFLRPPFFPSASTPNGFRQFGMSQEIPYPGKLSLRSQVASADADVVRWQYENTRVRLISELKAAYFEYLFVERSLDVVRRNRAVLDQIRSIAEARFSVGKASQPDVLRSQLEISLLLQRVATLQRQRLALQAEINRLAYRTPDTPVPVAEPQVLAAFDTSLTDLRARAGARFPAVKRDEQQIARTQQALALAKKEQMPDFGVTVTTQKPAGMEWMYGVDLMVRVPIFWQRKQRPMVAEATAALEEARHMRDATAAEATARVDQEYAAATAARNLTDLFSDSVLPQARLTLESSRAAYEVGTIDFLTLLSSVTAVLNNEIAYQEQIAQYRQALARLEPLVGTELIR
jgi:outer membrane protein TolC